MQLSFHVHSKCDSGMIEKLRKETQIQTKLSATNYIINYESPRRWVMLCLDQQISHMSSINPTQIDKLKPLSPTQTQIGMSILATCLLHMQQ